MSAKRTEIERGLGLLRESAVDRLSVQGWVGRDLSDGGIAAIMRSVATATRTGDNGVLLAVEIIRTSFTWPPRWPVEVTTRIGVGYEPALNLMPLVTLPPRAILVHDEAGGATAGLVVSLAGPPHVDPAAEQIADWVQQQAAGPISQFADAAAIDAELERRVALQPTRPAPARSDGGPKQRPVGIPERLVLLAAMGRHDQARALLETYEADDADPRFVRQLRRWLERGGPPAPPVEQTLAIVAAPAREPRPPRGQIWATARAGRNVENEAREATRARASGKSLQQLKALVATEYGVRGIELPSVAVAWHAELLLAEQRPFGRVRSTVKGLTASVAAARDGIRMARHRVPSDPDWLRPPQRASYPAHTDHTHHTAVEVEVSARSWVERVQAHAPRRIGPWILVDAWLTRDHPTGQLVVHIGEHRVGTVRPDDTHRFDRTMTAAALFDEDPVLQARLAPAGDPDSTPLVEVALPRSTPDGAAN